MFATRRKHIRMRRPAVSLYQYWLDAAVERFIKASRESNGHREAPFGLSTSFNLAR